MIQKTDYSDKAIKLYKKTTLVLHRTQRFIFDWHENIHEDLTNPHFEDLEEANILRKASSALKGRFPKSTIRNQVEARTTARRIGRAKQSIVKVQEYIRTQEKHVQAKAGYEAALAWKSLLPKVENLKHRVITCHSTCNKTAKTTITS